jgi:hypothetical protein
MKIKPSEILTSSDNTDTSGVFEWSDMSCMVPSAMTKHTNTWTSVPLEEISLSICTARGVPKEISIGNFINK